MRRRILVVGGGYAGFNVARRLRRRRDLEVTVVDPHGYLTYQPLLPEVAAGAVQPAHVTVPLRSALPGVRILLAALTGLDRDNRVATIATGDGRARELSYDELVLAVGSVTRTVPIPGLVDHAIGFRTVEEAVYLGGRVLSQVEVAAASNDPATRRRALTFVFVGGGYAGVELLGELHDMVRRALAHHSTVRLEDTRWVLVEAAPRILGALPDRLAAYTSRHLRGRGIEVRTDTSVQSLVGGVARLSDGTAVDADVVVWTAGVVANPVLRELGLPCDPAGRVVTDATLEVADGVWALGDCAAVPNLVGDGPCPPTAQHAARQATRLVRNLLGRRRPYRHADAGAVASLGLGKGVAELYGVPLRGLPAWLTHRLYHGSRLPCSRRRVLVNMLWLLGTRRDDLAPLTALASPRRPLRDAHARQSGPPPTDPAAPDQLSSSAPGALGARCANRSRTR